MFTVAMPVPERKAGYYAPTHTNDYSLYPTFAMPYNTPSVKEKLEAITSYLLQQAHGNPGSEILLNGIYDLLYRHPERIENNAVYVEGKGLKFGIPTESDRLPDKKRTMVLLQDIYEALQALKKEFNEPLHILYTGCGPMGTLVIPLLPLFDPYDIRLCFLDSDLRSINCVRQVIEESELSEYVDAYITADAATYRHARGEKFHMIVAETLEGEPDQMTRFGTAQNLYMMLAPCGKFLPEAIAE